MPVAGEQVEDKRKLAVALARKVVDDAASTVHEQRAAARQLAALIIREHDAAAAAAKAMPETNPLKDLAKQIAKRAANGREALSPLEGVVAPQVLDFLGLGLDMMKKKPTP
jgi:hypothetical protein